MNIKGDKITLRAVEEKDLTKLHEWANDPETQDIMGGIYFIKIGSKKLTEISSTRDLP